jgi:hypothetical protein
MEVLIKMINSSNPNSTANVLKRIILWDIAERFMSRCVNVGKVEKEFVGEVFQGKECEVIEVGELEVEGRVYKSHLFE